MRIGTHLARSPILAALAASALVAAGQPPAANPFAGKWTAEVRKHGKTQATKVVEIDGAGGWFHDVQTRKAGGPRGVCRNLRSPIEDVVFTETTLEFVVVRRRVVSGCSDLRFELRKEGDGLAGTMTGMDEDDEDLGTRRVILTR